MPLILPGNVGSATAATGYDVANSCRFNDGDSAYMHKTPGGAGTSADLFTFSMWIKRGIISSSDRIVLFYAQSDAQNFDRISFTDADVLEWKGVRSDSQAFNLTTSQVFRDISSWYHLHFIWDSADSTADNRMRIYVNGTQVTAFGTRANPSSGLDAIIGSAQKHSVGSTGSSGTYYDGYMAEVVYLDGQELTPDGNTGEFDEDSGIWKPIDVSGLTFGTNGFYLDFEDSANLGNDANGGTDFTETGLAATDQSTDTCTNNFATLNPLHSIGASSELSQGNLEYDPSGHHRIISTIAPSSGKWYAEVKGIDNPDKFNAGVCYYPIPANGSISSFAFGQGINGDVGRWSNDFGIKANGDYGHDNSWSSYMASLEGENNNIVGIYMDLDNYKLYFSKNGSLVSSTGKDLTNNGYPYGFISVGEAATFQWNFGNPSFAISSGNTDDNGYGNFEYSPNITGDGAAKKFYSLNSKNLAEYGG